MLASMSICQSKESIYLALVHHSQPMITFVLGFVKQTKEFATSKYYLQRTTHLLFPQATFMRIVREIVHQIFEEYFCRNIVVVLLLMQGT